MAEAQTDPPVEIFPVDTAVAPVAADSRALSTMLDAAHQAAPQEACGLLFGTNGQIRLATVARNVSLLPETQFEIDPRHLFAAQRQARRGPDSIIGCWHSHPDGHPLPSRLDRAGVTDMNWLWLIVAKGAIRGFVPVVQGFREVALQALDLVTTRQDGKG